MTDRRTSDGLSGPEAKAPEAARGGRSRLQSRRPQRHTRAHHPGGQAGTQAGGHGSSERTKGTPPSGGLPSLLLTRHLPHILSPSLSRVALHRTMSARHLLSNALRQGAAAPRTASKLAARPSLTLPRSLATAVGRSVSVTTQRCRRRESGNDGQSGVRRAFLSVMLRSMLC